MVLLIFLCVLGVLVFDVMIGLLFDDDHHDQDSGVQQW